MISFFFLPSFIRLSYFFSSNKIDPIRRLRSHSFNSEVLVWKQRMKACCHCQQKVGRYYFPKIPILRLHIHTLRSCFFTIMSLLEVSKHFFCFSFVSRYIYADPLHCNMTYLFIRLLKDDLKEYTYAARLSGLSYAIASGMNAILVSKMKTKIKVPPWLSIMLRLRKRLTSAFLNKKVVFFFLAPFE